MNDISKRISALAPLASVYKDDEQNFMGLQGILFGNEDFFTDMGFADFQTRSSQPPEDWFGAYAYREYQWGNRGLIALEENSESKSVRYFETPLELNEKLVKANTLLEADAQKGIFVLQTTDQERLSVLVIETRDVEFGEANFNSRALESLLKPIVEKHQGLSWLLEPKYNRLRKYFVQRPGSNGQPGWQLTKESVFDTRKGKTVAKLGYTDANATQFIRTIEQMSLLASPLFHRLLTSPPFFYSPETLFAEALGIYQNPYTALSVIAWLGAMESTILRNRTKQSIFGFKTQPIVHSANMLGGQYHFWGFLLRSIYGQSWRLWAISTILEKVRQDDVAEWYADRIGISVGESVRDMVLKEESCRSAER